MFPIRATFANVRKCQSSFSLKQNIKRLYFSNILLHYKDYISFNVSMFNQKVLFCILVCLLSCVHKSSLTNQ